jgi:hypothetical protein
MPVGIDIAGRKFGKLTAIDRHGSSRNGVLWRCRCDCGNEMLARASGLRKGDNVRCASCRSTDRYEIRKCELCGTEIRRYKGVWRKSDKLGYKACFCCRKHSAIWHSNRHTRKAILSSDPLAGVDELN